MRYKTETDLIYNKAMDQAKETKSSKIFVDIAEYHMSNDMLNVIIYNLMKKRNDKNHNNDDKETYDTAIIVSCTPMHNNTVLRISINPDALR